MFSLYFRELIEMHWCSLKNVLENSEQILLLKSTVSKSWIEYSTIYFLIQRLLIHIDLVEEEEYVIYSLNLFVLFRCILVEVIYTDGIYVLDVCFWSYNLKNWFLKSKGF